MQVVFRLVDGREFTVEDPQPGLADQIAFEHQLGVSFNAYAIGSARQSEEVAKQQAASADGDEYHVSLDALIPAEWGLFFAYRAVRRENPGKVPAKWAQFVELVDEVEYVAGPEADDAADEEQPPDPSGLDPTGSSPQPGSPPDSGSIAASAPPTSA